jgi:SM-20-related protein
MIPARIDNWDPGHPIHALTDFLNSGDFINFARRNNSYYKVTKIDAHASYYRPGESMTTQQHRGDLNERRASNTLSFSRDWRADWGGLLLFHNKKNDFSRGY